MDLINGLKMEHIKTFHCSGRLSPPIGRIVNARSFLSRP